MMECQWKLVTRDEPGVGQCLVACHYRDDEGADHWVIQTGFRQVPGGYISVAYGGMEEAFWAPIPDLPAEMKRAFADRGQDLERLIESAA